MDMTHRAGAEVAKAEPATVLPGQVVLAFQGGGALTAYQCCQPAPVCSAAARSIRAPKHRVLVSAGPRAILRWLRYREGLRTG